MKFPKPFVKKKNTGHVYAIIETPQGSRNKYDYEPEMEMFLLDKILPAGTAFPLNFGFIPRTIAEDGDPLDVLVITDSPGVTGCVVECRVLGVIEAIQTEKDKHSERNDRLLAVSCASLDHSEVKSMKDVNKNLLDELEHFFEYYNEMCGKKFKMIGTKGPKDAVALITKHAKDYKEKQSKK